MTVSEQSHGVMTVSEGHAHDLAARVNEQERSTLRQNVDAFNNVTSISLRNRFFWGFLGCCAALALIFLLFGSVGLAARILVFGFLGGLSYHIVVEMAGRRVVLVKGLTERIVHCCTKSLILPHTLYYQQLRVTT